MISLRIAEVLREKNKSLYWLAKESGVTYTTVHRLAQGNPIERLDFRVLEKLARALDREPGELLVMTDDE